MAARQDSNKRAEDSQATEGERIPVTRRLVGILQANSDNPVRKRQPRKEMDKDLLRKHSTKEVIQTADKKIN